MRSDIRAGSFGFTALTLAAALSLGAGCSEEADPPHPATSTSASSSGAGGEGGSGGMAPIVVSDGISISDQSSSEHEPQLVVCEGGRVVVSWVDRKPDNHDQYHVAYRVSDDLGASWGAITSIPQLPDNNIASNATLAAAADGTVYLGYASELVDQTGTRSHQHVWLATMAPGASTFSTPVELTDPDKVVGVYDQPAITITPSGRLLVTYGEADESLQNVWIVTQVSDDHGATWSTVDPLHLDDGETVQNLIHPCASKGGDGVYLYFFDLSRGLVLWPSHDDASSFDPEGRITVQAPNENGTVSTLLDGNCVSEGNEVWVIYGLTDQPNGANQKVPRLNHIAIAHSSDGGASIDWRAKVEDGAVGPHYLLPRLAVENGGVDVTYYAGTDEGDAKASYRTARSTDGGKTFAPSTEVLAPVTYELKRTTEQWFGDYMGLKAKDGALYGAFIDNSKPQAHVSFFSRAQ